MRMPVRLVGAVHSPLGQRWGTVINVDARLRSHAHHLGVDTRWSPALLLGVTCVALIMVGVHIGGVIGGPITATLIAVVLVVTNRQVQRQIDRIAQEALTEVVLHLSRALRSGETFERALAGLGNSDIPLTRGMGQLVRQVRTGRPLDSALEAWLANASSSPEQLLAAAMTLGVSHGGTLARTLDGVGEALRDELELAARRRILLAQTTMSAGVLVALPVVFAIVVSVVRGTSVFGDTVGLGLLVAGLVLDAVGLWWMAQMLRRLR